MQQFSSLSRKLALGSLFFPEEHPLTGAFWPQPGSAELPAMAPALLSSVRSAAAGRVTGNNRQPDSDFKTAGAAVLGRAGTDYVRSLLSLSDGAARTAGPAPGLALRPAEGAPSAAAGAGRYRPLPQGRGVERAGPSQPRRGARGEGRGKEEGRWPLLVEATAGHAPCAGAGSPAAAPRRPGVSVCAQRRGHGAACGVRKAPLAATRAVPVVSWVQRGAPWRRR